MSENPLFIAFEGIDGSGKSTQSELAHRYLIGRGMKSVLLAEPSMGPWGEQIRAMLSSESLAPPEEQHRLFLLDRDDDVTANIRPALSAGITVVMDRYYYSNAAYQGAAGLSPKSIIADNMKRGFPEPHRVYCIDLEPETAIERIALRNRGSGADCFERLHFLRRVREIYLSLESENFIIIDGSKFESVIHETILDDLVSRFHCGSAPIF